MSQRFEVFWGLRVIIIASFLIFAQIAAPLTNLTRKNTPFTWSLREGEAFKALKDVLQHAPILQLENPSRDYIVTADASDFAIGTVLSQVWED